MAPSPARPRVAFYAPMKPPDHAVPSGDRLIARLTMTALERAGFAPFLASRLRILDLEGSAAAQARLGAAAEAEAARVAEALGRAPPALWFTYHSHYKAPDLVGPRVAGALGIPYVVSEASTAPARRQGPWAEFAALSDAALEAADRLFWTTPRDRPALEAAGWGAKMVELPAFIDPGPAPPPPRPAGTPLALLTVAMMRPGEKLESYRRLARALRKLEGAWRLTVIGAGAAEPEVRALLAPFGEQVAFLGAIDAPATLRAHYEAADLFLWPGVGEGVGMAWLEAQAAGLPVVAEDGPAARALVKGGVLAPVGESRALAEAIAEAAGRRKALSAAARAHVEARHSLDAAAAILRTTLGELLA